MSIIIREIQSEDELKLVLDIRHDVFVRGQNVPLDRERDSYDTDKDTRHAIVFDSSDGKEKPIGCARVRLLNGKAKLERIAVIDDYRGKGMGKKLMEFLIDYCKQSKDSSGGYVTEIVMHSQCYIAGFYEQFGFVKQGDVFMDAGIEHVEMVLKI